MKDIYWSVLVSIFFWTKLVFAYDAETHALITLKAFERSALNASGEGTLLSELGIDRLDERFPFSAYWSPYNEVDPSYYDNAPYADLLQIPSLNILRYANSYEKCKLQYLAASQWIVAPDRLLDDTGAVNNLPIEEWLVRGAIREDDLKPNHYSGDSCFPPEEDPNGSLDRVLNHFYDPIHDRGLTPYGAACQLVLGVPCLKSVDWALGYVDSFESPPLRIDTARRNHFSYEDAREDMWLALTLDRGAATLPYTAAARSADSAERLTRWATTFGALGDTIHLLQDGAQPQHVRNDPHDPYTASTEQMVYEHFTNSRVLRQSATQIATGDGGDYVRDFFDADSLNTTLPAIELGDYPSTDTPYVMFSTPVRFFSTRSAGEGPDVSPSGRYGLIDYTNRGFFTPGSRPGSFRSVGNTFAEPPIPLDATQGYTSVSMPCFMSSLVARNVSDLTCTHIMHAVPDSIAPGYVDALPGAADGSIFTAPPILMESSFKQTSVSLGIITTTTNYAIGIEELLTMANLTIPRAIGYSAGFVNYFFRGRIALSSPPDGLYAVLDQGTPHGVADGVPYLADASSRTFGFTALRVRAKNATLPISDPGKPTPDAPSPVLQTMHGNRDQQANPTGQLVAIARYHRNPCYMADLSGEFVRKFNLDGTPQPAYVPSGCTVEQTRTSNPEIAVSAPIYINAQGGLPGVPPNSPNTCINVGNINTGVDSTYTNCENDAALLEFDFSNDPIPINATDLFLQVAYRGPLGEELDGIAVGAVDILEPQYYSSWNNTDWYLYHNQWYPPQNVPNPPGPDAATPADITEESICFGSQRVVHLQSPSVLSPTQFLRIAVLTDVDEPSLGAVATYEDLETINSDAPKPTFPRQSDKENAGHFVSDPLYYGRGTTLGFDLSNFFFLYTQDPWVYDFPHIADLSPALGSPDTPGISYPLADAVSFTSLPDQFCVDKFPDFPVHGYGEAIEGFVKSSRQTTIPVGRRVPLGGGITRREQLP